MSVKGFFGSKELCKALDRLGFVSLKQYSSSHQKWKPPKSCPIPPGIRPFIIVVQAKKEYFQPTYNGYIKQIRQFGFSIEQIGKAFKD